MTPTRPAIAARWSAPRRWSSPGCNRGISSDEIERDAIDPDSDVPGLLRKCIRLGGATGSERLRAWAALELKGYNGDDALPEYRKIAAPLVLDGANGNILITGQSVPAMLIPDFARDDVTDQVQLGSPIAEIIDLIQSARRTGNGSVRFGIRGGRELVAVINHNLYKDEVRRWGQGPPTRVVERIYNEATLAPLSRIVDVVRTTVIELVAEMRAGLPPGQVLPDRELAEQAVEVAIHGHRNRVIQNVYVGDHGQLGASEESDSPPDVVESEPHPRRIMYWVSGLAGAAAAIVTVVTKLF